MMLRLFYRALLRLHPPYFRRRFSGEMLSIFDQQNQILPSLKLIADGLLSLLRQWILRPRFWQERGGEPAPDHGFYLTRKFRPGAGSLLDGALISLAAFAAVCMVMQYTWEHPVYMPMLSYYRRAPQAAQAHPTTAPTAVVRHEPIYMEGGRLILIVQNPSRHAAAKP
jgi:hypothetical protein